MNAHEQSPDIVLPSSVQAFLQLGRNLEKAMANGDPVNVTEARGIIKKFYGTLHPEAQKEVEKFLRQQSAGLRIADESNKYYIGMQRVLNWPHMAVRTAANTIPQLAKETVRLIIQTLGMSIRGFIEGIDNVFNKAA